MSKKRNIDLDDDDDDDDDGGGGSGGGGYAADAASQQALQSHIQAIMAAMQTAGQAPMQHKAATACRQLLSSAAPPIQLVVVAGYGVAIFLTLEDTDGWCSYIAPLVTVSYLEAALYFYL